MARILDLEAGGEVWLMTLGEEAGGVAGLDHPHRVARARVALRVALGRGVAGIIGQRRIDIAVSGRGLEAARGVLLRLGGRLERPRSRMTVRGKAVAQIGPG